MKKIWDAGVVSLSQPGPFFHQLLKRLPAGDENIARQWKLDGRNLFGSYLVGFIHVQAAETSRFDLK